MTLDLDELERKAKVALSYDPDPGEDPWFRGRLHPDAVLALIERVRAAEETQACEHGISGPRCFECPDGVTQHWRGVRELQERVRTAEAMQKSCNVANANLEARVRELERLNEQSLRLAESQSEAYGQAMTRVATLDILRGGR